MHCKGCDKLLSNFESKRKDKYGEFLDLCGKCIQYTKEDLRPINEPVNDESDWGVDDDI